jgi:putative transposase
MPWKEQRKMSLKIEFVERAALRGANVAALCREYGISRETGHKWIRRYKKNGYNGLSELSRRPKTSPLSSSEEMVVAVIACKEKYPAWGPEKIGVILKRTLQNVPSRSTIARVLKRLGMVEKRNKKRPYETTAAKPVTVVKRCNDLWTQ